MKKQGMWAVKALTELYSYVVIKNLIKPVKEYHNQRI
jgi:hypothetical protein